MNQVFKVGVGFWALAALATTALAAPLTGVWKGHVEINMANLPPAPSPQAKAQMMSGLERTKKMVLLLNLKADKSFTVSMGDQPKGSAPMQTGTWSLSGRKLSLQGTAGGKNNGAPQVFVLSKDQKSFSMSQKNPSTQKEIALITFTR